MGVMNRMQTPNAATQEMLTIIGKRCERVKKIF